MVPQKYQTGADNLNGIQIKFVKIGAYIFSYIELKSDGILLK